MKISSILSSGFVIASALQFVAAYPGSGVALTPRKTSILINPAAQPDLPTAAQAQAAASAASLNLDDIQGDILIGMKKNQELFFFFSITNSTLFKQKLKSDIKVRVTTTTQLLSVSSQPTTALNVAFSQQGLNALGVTDDLGDPLFTAGQEADASVLGDPGTTNWVPSFVGKQIHGVFLLASDTTSNLNSFLSDLNAILQGAIQEVYSLNGAARPGDQQGHEHFGFLDGISQPAVTGFNTPLPGQELVAPGVILVGEDSDPVATRPTWAKDGSFLAFRQLSQKVPEFEKFLTDNPIIEDGLTPAQGSALLGARLVGRWKSGAPVDLAPKFDDPVLAADPTRNNNFTFAHPGQNILNDQTNCPFTAHIRKTKPRADFPTPNPGNHIIRAGIPYGPEVGPAEAASNTTVTERGLAFVAYQSDISNGFHFLQHTWANNVGFFFNKNQTQPGWDPLIGANGGQPRWALGLDQTNFDRNITLENDFIVSRGGEYFFSPSLSALSGALSA
ncbi:hypothetical protein M422DRAFT_29451 [Sphaerobolus stellatus SS14]|uniref:Peroxidase n=1 Tax=Sphaerobolus stellatus (strain SS14) TaxID=990650 RepID=A0A0C9UT91_SPHS4|nr:hypothetical protein M422DRAFT_29451 [Sphaerobolus stellatus SS14]